MHEDAQSDTLHERAKNPPNHRQTYNNLQINSREIVSELENDQQNHFDDDVRIFPNFSKNENLC